VVAGGAGDHEAGARRDEQGGELGDEPVADGEQRVGLGRLGQRDVVAHEPGHEPAHDVDGGDGEAGHRVAADELGGAVHGAEELGLALQGRAAGLRLAVVDDAGGQVGVDRHLLAGHRVESEASRHLGDAPGALGDDREVHHQQDEEDDEPDHQAAAHREASEGLDEVAGRARTLAAVEQDEPGGGDVEREPEEGGDEQQRREDREVERAGEAERGQEHEQRQAHREGEQHVQHCRRHRDDEDDHDRQDRDGQEGLGARRAGGRDLRAHAIAPLPAVRPVTR
jgi:hypothetical protein